MAKHSWVPFDEDGQNMICINCHQYISYHQPNEWEKYFNGECTADQNRNMEQ